MLESSLDIGDDILQQELSRSADEKMKNIVATVQREQNAVIRNEVARVLILQGVAGSGTTSIALHRVAFLLYRFKDTLSSNDVMILSSNKVFGDYISSVLPELGEEQVAETDFDTIAGRFLTEVVDHESFSQQVMKLLEAVDDATAVRQQVRAMFAYKDAYEMYQAFYRTPERQGLFVPLGRKKIEYADVFPLIYTVLTTTRQEGPHAGIRHLLVDEMQDYTPVQYAVLRHLFSCRMTILGDANQSVNPFSSSSLETIHRIIPEADCLELTESYRSTAEITEFAQNISRNDRLTPIVRPRAVGPAGAHIGRCQRLRHCRCTCSCRTRNPSAWQKNAGREWGAGSSIVDSQERSSGGVVMDRSRPQCWLTDMDGVLVREGEALPGAADFLQRLVDQERRFLVLTNNSIYTPRDLAARLAESGLSVPEESIWTSALATAGFLADQVPRGSAYVVGEAGLTTALYEVGYTLTDVSPDYVVLGETRTYSFEAITKAIRLIESGARFIATNPDPTGPSAEGPVPATGAVAALITRATGAVPYFVGKPNPMMFRSAMNRIQAHSESTVMIGDRMDTDVVAGIEAGLETILVLSGSTHAADITQYPYRPGRVLDSIADVIDLI